jgi:hypothetical protein
LVSNGKHISTTFSIDISLKIKKALACLYKS